MAENILYLLGAFLLVAGAGYFVSTAWTTMGGVARLLTIQAGLGLLAALVLGLGRLALGRRAGAALPELQRLERVTAHLAVCFAPLAALVAGRILLVSPPVGLLSTAAAVGAAWAAARRAGPVPWTARWITAATFACAVAGLAAPWSVVAALALVALVQVAVPRAEVGAAPLALLGFASGVAALHLSIAAGSASPLAVLSGGWALALARRNGARVLAVASAGLAIAAIAPAVADPVALLWTCALAATTTAVVGLRLDSLRLFSPALLLSLGAYVLSPAPVRDLALAARDTIAVGLGYGGEPLPLSWYGLTCLPYVLGVGAAVHLLRRRGRGEHAAVVLRWLGLVAAGLCALSFSATDLRAPAAVLAGEGAALLGLGLWLRARALVVAAPLAISGAVACLALHHSLAPGAALLLLEAALGACLLATRRWHGELRPPLRWATALPPVLAAAALFAAPSTAWDLPALLVAAAIVVARAQRTHARAATGERPHLPLELLVPLATALLWRATWPLLPDPTWHLAATATLALATIGLIIKQCGLFIRPILAGALTVPVMAGAVMSAAPLAWAHVVGVVIAVAFLVAAARWMGQRWAAVAATVGLAIALSGAAALSLGWGPVSWPGVAAISGLVAVWASRRVRDELSLRYLRGPVMATGAALGLVGWIGCWVLWAAGLTAPGVGLGALVLALAVSLSVPRTARGLVHEALAAASLTGPALALLLLAARVGASVDHTLLLVAVAPWFIWATAHLRLLPRAVPYVRTAMLVSAWLVGAVVGARAVETLLLGGSAIASHGVTLLLVTGAAWLAARRHLLLGGAAMVLAVTVAACTSLGVPGPWQPAAWAASALLATAAAHWPQTRLDSRVARGAAAVAVLALFLLGALFCASALVAEPRPHEAHPAIVAAAVGLVLLVRLAFPGRPGWLAAAAVPLVHALPLVQWATSELRLLHPDVELAMLAVLFARRAPRVALALALFALTATGLEPRQISTPLALSVLVAFPARRGRPEVSVYVGLLAAFAWIAFAVPSGGRSPWEILPVFALAAAAAAAWRPARLNAALGHRARRVTAVLSIVGLLALGANLLVRVAHPAPTPVAWCALAAAASLVATAVRRRWVDLGLGAAALIHAFLAIRTDWLAPVDGYHTLLWGGLGLACVLSPRAARRVRVYALWMPAAGLFAHAVDHGGSALASLLAASVYLASGQRRGAPAHTWIGLALVNLAAVRGWMALEVVDPAFYGVPLGLSLVAATRLERRCLEDARAAALQLAGLALAYGSIGFVVLRINAPLHALALFIAGLATVAIGARTGRGHLLVAGVAAVALDVVLYLVQSGFARGFGTASLLVAAGAVVLGAAAFSRLARAPRPPSVG